MPGGPSTGAPSRPERRWTVAIDRGGTFTDLVARDGTGRERVLKVPSSTPDGRDPALAALRKLLDVRPDEPLPESALAGVRIGTTLATNALLERHFPRTLFVTTRGFGDALRIGTQSRPDLFALEVRLPAPLTSEVLEVDERVDAQGRIVQPLDQDATLAALTRARADGVVAVAITLLHASRFPAHEQAVAALARAAGFQQVVCSHETVALPRFLPRAETTVADAALTPRVRAWLSHLRSELPTTALAVMQSNGGLVRAEDVRGKDVVLSGPAGGAVAVGAVAARCGLSRLVGLDMGGTSTDVCAVDTTTEHGGLEHRWDGEVGSIRLAVPMVFVHTIAAGGGSRLACDGEGLKVGPASAGALPGPAAYGHGGPATITDALAVVGRLDPMSFPAVLGPTGDRGLDVAAARAALAHLVASTPSHSPVQVERLASDFLRVAAAAMARGIGRVTIERGLDVRTFAICAFGGAAGQLGCHVADALDVTCVIVPRHAGALSAVGILDAPHRTIEQRALGCLLDEDGLSLAHEAATALRLALSTSHPDATITTSLLVKSRGSDTTLAVPLSAGAADAFVTSHVRRFGTVPRAPFHIDVVVAEAVSPSCPSAPAVYDAPAPADRVGKLWREDAFCDVPIIDERAIIDRHVDGPALVLTPTATVVVDDGWRLNRSPFGDLRLERVRPKTRGAAVRQCDPALLAVYGHRLMAVAESMGLVLEQTSSSVNIKERRDYSCALFDAHGRLIANAPHIPVHLGSMGESVKVVMAARNQADPFAPGDGFLVNDPYAGGTHLPDLTVVSPVFVSGHATPDFFVASRGHHADVGGITPGSMPATSRTIHEEGLLSRGARIATNFTLDTDATYAWLAGGPYPARHPDQNVADLAAQLGANERGEQRLKALVSEAGLDEVTAYMGHLTDQAASAVRRLLGRLEDGQATCRTDDGATIAVRLSVTGRGSAAPHATRACIDFSGTSPAVATNANAPRAVVRAAVLYALRVLTGEDIPLNDGCLEPIDLIIPDDSLLSPPFPAAVVAGNVETSQLVCDALFLACGALAGSQGTMNNVAFGNANVQYYETICGGTGAGATFDGDGPVQSHMTNSRITDPEVLEARVPVRIEVFSTRRGSGGAGRHVGGDGATRRLRFLAPMHLSIMAGRRDHAPPGLRGGHAGLPGRQWLERADGTVEPLGSRVDVEVKPGDLLVIETPGGGGFGPPSTEPHY